MAEIHDVADAHVDEFLAALRLVPDDLDPDEFERAVLAGNAERAIALWTWRPRIVEVLGKVALEAALLAQRDLPREPVVKAVIVTSLDEDFSEAGLWAQQHGADLVVDVNRRTRQAIREVTADAVEHGGHPYAQARELMNSIPLLPQQRGVAERMAREGASSEAVARYEKRALRHRARVIARTETMFAANEGQRLLWEKAADTGFLDPSVWAREWVATPDERTCDECGPLDGQATEVGRDRDGNLSNAAWPASVASPPVHPQCRCSTSLVPIESVRDRLITGAQVERLSFRPEMLTFGMAARDLVQGFAMMGAFYRYGHRLIDLTVDNFDLLSARIPESWRSTYDSIHARLKSLQTQKDAIRLHPAIESLAEAAALSNMMLTPYGFTFANFNGMNAALRAAGAIVDRAIGAAYTNNFYEVYAAVRQALRAAMTRRYQLVDPSWTRVAMAKPRPGFTIPMGAASDVLPAIGNRAVYADMSKYMSTIKTSLTPAQAMSAADNFVTLFGDTREFAMLNNAVVAWRQGQVTREHLAKGIIDAATDIEDRYAQVLIDHVHSAERTTEPLYKVMDVTAEQFRSLKRTTYAEGAEPVLDMTGLKTLLGDIPTVGTERRVAVVRVEPGAQAARVPMFGSEAPIAAFADEFITYGRYKVVERIRHRPTGAAPFDEFVIRFVEAPRRAPEMSPFALALGAVSLRIAEIVERLALTLPPHEVAEKIDDMERAIQEEAFRALNRVIRAQIAAGADPWKIVVDRFNKSSVTIGREDPNFLRSAQWMFEGIREAEAIFDATYGHRGTPPLTEERNRQIFHERWWRAVEGDPSEPRLGAIASAIKATEPTDWGAGDTMVRGIGIPNVTHDDVRRRYLPGTTINMASQGFTTNTGTAHGFASHGDVPVVFHVHGEAPMLRVNNMPNHMGAASTSYNEEKEFLSYGRWKILRQEERGGRIHVHIEWLGFQYTIPEIQDTGTSSDARSINLRPADTGLVLGRGLDETRTKYAAGLRGDDERVAEIIAKINAQEVAVHPVAMMIQPKEKIASGTTELDLEVTRVVSPRNLSIGLSQVVRIVGGFKYATLLGNAETVLTHGKFRVVGVWRDERQREVFDIEAVSYPGVERDIMFPSRVEQLARTLVVAPPDRRISGGTHDNITLLDPDDNRWLFKPQEQFRAEADVAANKLMQALGLPTPDMYIVTWNGRVGSLQSVFEGTRKVVPSRKSADPETIPTNVIYQLQIQQVVDWMFDNHDAHFEQFMLDDSGEIVLGIDKGQAFRYFGEAAQTLDPSYNPNQKGYGVESVYTIVHRAIKQGKSIDYQDLTRHKMTQLEDMIKSLQHLPDARVRDIFRPYAEAAAAARSLAVSSPRPNDVDWFLDQLTDRKTALLRDFKALHQTLRPQPQRTPAPAPTPTPTAAPTSKVDQLLAAVTHPAAPLPGIGFHEMMTQAWVTLQTDSPPKFAFKPVAKELLGVDYEAGDGSKILADLPEKTGASSPKSAIKRFLESVEGAMYTPEAVAVLLGVDNVAGLKSLVTALIADPSQHNDHSKSVLRAFTQDHMSPMDQVMRKAASILGPKSFLDLKGFVGGAVDLKPHTIIDAMVFHLAGDVSATQHLAEYLAVPQKESQVKAFLGEGDVVKAIEDMAKATWPLAQIPPVLKQALAQGLQDGKTVGEVLIAAPVTAQQGDIAKIWLGAKDEDEDLVDLDTSWLPAVTTAVPPTQLTVNMALTAMKALFSTHEMSEDAFKNTTGYALPGPVTPPLAWSYLQTLFPLPPVVVEVAKAESSGIHFNLLPLTSQQIKTLMIHAETFVGGTPMGDLDWSLIKPTPFSERVLQTIAPSVAAAIIEKASTAPDPQKTISTWFSDEGFGLGGMQGGQLVATLKTWHIKTVGDLQQALSAAPSAAPVAPSAPQASPADKFKALTGSTAGAGAAAVASAILSPLSYSSIEEIFTGLGMPDATIDAVKSEFGITGVADLFEFFVEDAKVFESDDFWIAISGDNIQSASLAATSISMWPASSDGSMIEFAFLDNTSLGDDVVKQMSDIFGIFGITHLSDLKSHLPPPPSAQAPAQYSAAIDVELITGLTQQEILQALGQNDYSQVTLAYFVEDVLNLQPDTTADLQQASIHVPEQLFSAAIDGVDFSKILEWHGVADEIWINALMRPWGQTGSIIPQTTGYSTLVPIFNTALGLTSGNAIFTEMHEEDSLYLKPNLTPVYADWLADKFKVSDLNKMSWLYGHNAPTKAEILSATGYGSLDSLVEKLISKLPHWSATSQFSEDPIGADLVTLGFDTLGFAIAVLIKLAEEPVPTRVPLTDTILLDLLLEHAPGEDLPFGMSKKMELAALGIETYEDLEPHIRTALEKDPLYFLASEVDPDVTLLSFYESALTAVNLEDLFPTYNTVVKLQTVGVTSLSDVIELLHPHVPNAPSITPHIWNYTTLIEANRGVPHSDPPVVLSSAVSIPILLFHTLLKVNGLETAGRFVAFLKDHAPEASTVTVHGSVIEPELDSFIATFGYEPDSGIRRVFEHWKMGLLTLSEVEEELNLLTLPGDYGKLTAMLGSFGFAADLVLDALAQGPPVGWKDAKKKIAELKYAGHFPNVPTKAQMEELIGKPLTPEVIQDWAVSVTSYEHKIVASKTLRQVVPPSMIQQMAQDILFTVHPDDGTAAWSAAKPTIKAYANHDKKKNVTAALAEEIFGMQAPSALAVIAWATALKAAQAVPSIPSGVWVDAAQELVVVASGGVATPPVSDIQGMVTGVSFLQGLHGGLDELLEVVLTVESGENDLQALFSPFVIEVIEKTTGASTLDELHNWLEAHGASPPAYDSPADIITDAFDWPALLLSKATHSLANQGYLLDDAIQNHANHQTIVALESALLDESVHSFAELLEYAPIEISEMTSDLTHAQRVAVAQYTVNKPIWQIPGMTERKAAELLAQGILFSAQIELEDAHKNAAAIVKKSGLPYEELVTLWRGDLFEFEMLIGIDLADRYTPLELDDAFRVDTTPPDTTLLEEFAAIAGLTTDEVKGILVNNPPAVFADLETSIGSGAPELAIQTNLSLAAVMQELGVTDQITTALLWELDPATIAFAIVKGGANLNQLNTSGTIAGKTWSWVQALGLYSADQLLQFLHAEVFSKMTKAPWQNEVGFLTQQTIETWLATSPPDSAVLPQQLTPEGALALIQAGYVYASDFKTPAQDLVGSDDGYTSMLDLVNIDHGFPSYMDAVYHLKQFAGGKLAAQVIDFADINSTDTTDVTLFLEKAIKAKTWSDVYNTADGYFDMIGVSQGEATEFFKTAFDVDQAATLYDWQKTIAVGPFVDLRPGALPHEAVQAAAIFPGAAAFVAEVKASQDWTHLVVDYTGEVTAALLAPLLPENAKEAAALLERALATDNDFLLDPDEVSSVAAAYVIWMQSGSLPPTVPRAPWPDGGFAFSEMLFAINTGNFSHTTHPLAFAQLMESITKVGSADAQIQVAISASQKTYDALRAVPQAADVDPKVPMVAQAVSGLEGRWINAGLFYATDADTYVAHSMGGITVVTRTGSRTVPTPGEAARLIAGPAPTVPEILGIEWSELENLMTSHVMTSQSTSLAYFIGLHARDATPEMVARVEAVTGVTTFPGLMAYLGVDDPVESLIGMFGFSKMDQLHAKITASPNLEELVASVATSASQQIAINAVLKDTYNVRTLDDLKRATGYDEKRVLLRMLPPGALRSLQTTNMASIYEWAITDGGMTRERGTALVNTLAGMGINKIFDLLVRLDRDHPAFAAIRSVFPVHPLYNLKNLAVHMSLFEFLDSHTSLTASQIGHAVTTLQHAGVTSISDLKALAFRMPESSLDHIVFNVLEVPNTATLLTEIAQMPPSVSLWDWITDELDFTAVEADKITAMLAGLDIFSLEQLKNAATGLSTPHPKNPDVMIHKPTPPGPGVALPSTKPPVAVDIAWIPPLLGEPDDSAVSKAGAIVVWGEDVVLVEPTNHYAGTKRGLPKGSIDPGESPREAAIREVYEETGLVVDLEEWVADVGGVRYYVAVVIDGEPESMGWETQALHFVSADAALATLTKPDERAAFFKWMNPDVDVFTVLPGWYGQSHAKHPALLPYLEGKNYVDEWFQKTQGPPGTSVPVTPDLTLEKMGVGPGTFPMMVDSDGYSSLAFYMDATDRALYAEIAVLPQPFIDASASPVNAIVDAFGSEANARLHNWLDTWFDHTFSSAELIEAIRATSPPSSWRKKKPSDLSWVDTLFKISTGSYRGTFGTHSFVVYPNGSGVLDGASAFPDTRALKQKVTS